MRQQYLKAGLVDEMELHVVPVLLGGGERLFEGAGTELHGLRPGTDRGDPGGHPAQVCAARGGLSPQLTF
jgi:dihydrofolate reductase